ncbi:SAM-dependent methyltransferase [Mesorhizobium sp.]|uniref:SAM-dependent methyltransferase n=1 Tax=Mesorhizobium sp. TaxID=1871066 RepID=UPI0025E40A9A|nr:SAM-dependent methyltransferase [Mesorhizobium sp.]
MSDVVAFDASGLAETVERARALLDDGDVAAARMLAAGVYDQAKAGAAFAARFGAAERLVAKARRLQGDALLIEARAKVRLADEYDAAQANGEASKGRPKSREDGKTFTQAEAGLTSKEVHEARRLRDAELRTPGIVERAIAARLAAGLEPSRANLRAAVGTDTATAAERGNNLYETPPEAMRALLSLTRFGPKVWEPACGKGAISRMLENAGYEVELSDLVDYGTATKDGELQRVEDFLESAAQSEDAKRPDIVTNPPYGTSLNAFVAHALRAHRPRRMALLLNLNFLCGFDDPDRNFAMDENPPAMIYVFTRRLPMMHRDGWTGPEASSRMNTAWFIWELRQQADGSETYDGATELLRIDWKVFENATPVGPADDAAPERVTAVPPADQNLLAMARKLRERKAVTA